MARKQAGKESRDTGFNFHPDGETIDIRDGDNNFGTLTFPELGSVAIRSVRAVDDAVKNLLPEGGEDLLSTFDFRRLQDNYADRNTIFNQEENKVWIQPIVQRVRKLLFQCGERRHSIMRRNGCLNYAKARKWLQRGDCVCSGVVTHFSITCGVCPRPSQFKHLQHDSTDHDGKWRNLFMVDGLPALGNPDAKQIDRDLQECLWTLTEMLARPFMFYLAVIRPLIIELLERMGLLNKIHLSHIFVHSIPKRRDRHALFWTGPEVNNAIQRHAEEITVSLTAGLLRKLTTAMFVEYYPELFCESDKSPDPVDNQGQHTRQVRQIHYEHILNVPPALNMSLSKAQQYMAVSQLTQSIYSLARVGKGLDHVLESSPIFSRMRNGQIALLTARYLVCARYGINKSRGQDAVKRILDSRPYLGSEDVSTLQSFYPNVRSKFLSLRKQSFGDDVLVEVTRSVICGVEVSSALSVLPPTGAYSEEDIATAVTKVKVSPSENHSY